MDNLLEADYALCIRGSANYCGRIYEAMCLGRIPLVIDTDRLMPSDDLVPYRELCCWLDEVDADSIGDVLCDFHAGLTPSSFREPQHECRRPWVEHLSPLGFFCSFSRHFADRADERQASRSPAAA